MAFSIGGTIFKTRLIAVRVPNERSMPAGPMKRIATFTRYASQCGKSAEGPYRRSIPGALEPQLLVETRH